MGHRERMEARAGHPMEQLVLQLLQARATVQAPFGELELGWQQTEPAMEVLAVQRVLLAVLA